MTSQCGCSGLARQGRPKAWNHLEEGLSRQTEQKLQKILKQKQAHWGWKTKKAPVGGGGWAGGDGVA